jgi:mRNA-degrading endonuclease RelE of RelBE toxin-antitoxin system
MTVEFTPQFARQFQKAPEEIQKAFGKQLGHLLRNPRHPSLHAKKYDEAHGIWQARVNGGWRFYYQILADRYLLIEIHPHPK